MYVPVDHLDEGFDNDQINGVKRNVKKVRKRIEGLIKEDNLVLRDTLGNNVIDTLQLERHRQLDNIELYKVETLYVKTALKIWLEKSVENVSLYLDETTDISQEMAVILEQLDSIQSLLEIPNKLNSQSTLFKWCDGGPFQLIIKQTNLFESTKNSYLSNIRFNLFKTVCVDKIFAQCINSDLQLTFILSLSKFFNFINLRPERQNIVDDDFVKDKIENDNIQGRDLIKILVERSNNFKQEDTNSNVSVEQLRKSVKSLSDDDWTPNLQSLSKEICKRFLLPRLSFQEKTDDGRRVLVVEGAVIRISQIQSEMEKRKTNLKAEEVHIVGLATVYIDSDLPKDIWHGTNVVVLTDKLVVDNTKPVHWNLSGQDGKSIPMDAKPALDDEIDGLAGEHGMPGESGGNVHVTYNQIFNPANWTIESNGGRGNSGQYGGNGKNGKDGKKATNCKVSTEDFNGLFEKLDCIAKENFQSSWNREELLEKLKNLLGNVRFTSLAGEIDCFKIMMGNPYHATAMASFWEDKCSFLFWQGEEGELQMGGSGGEGGKGGPGGYGGTIVLEKRPTCHEEELFDTDHQQERQSGQILTISQGGEQGVDGKHGEGGKCGKRGQSIGDVVYIDNMAESSPGPNYFGLETEEKFGVRCINKYAEQSEFSHPYTKCKLDYSSDSNTDHKLCSFFPIKETPTIVQMATTVKGRQRETIPEATKKNAVTLQSFIHHLAKINERNRAISHLRENMNQPIVTAVDHGHIRMSQLIKDTARYNPFFKSSTTFYQLNDNVGINNGERDKQQVLHQKSLNSLHVLETTCDNLLKSGMDSDASWNELFPVCHSDQIQPKRIQHGIERIETMSSAYEDDTELIQYQEYPQQISRYLEIKPTCSDQDSILHAALGEKDQSSNSYLCKNVEKLKSEWESKTRDKLNMKNYSCSEIKQSFVLRLTDQSDQDHFKDGWQMKNDYLDYIRSSINNPIEELQKKLEKGAQQIKESWNAHPILYISRWPEEYFNLIKTRGLGLAEFQEIPNVSSFPIYQNVNERAEIDSCDDQTEDLETMTLKIHAKNSTDLLKKSILHAGEGVWQRLEPINTSHREYFRNRLLRSKVFREFYPQEGTLSTGRPKTGVSLEDLKVHKELTEWLKQNSLSDNQSHQDCYRVVMTCVKMINPKYGCTPGELSRLLLKYFIKAKEDAKDDLLHDSVIRKLAKDVVFLTERVIDYDSRQIDPIYYLTIVANLLDSRLWKYEFVLLEIEERIKIARWKPDRQLWRQHLYKLESEILDVLRERISAAGEQGDFPINEDRLYKILEMLAEKDLPLTKKDVAQLSRLPLNGWYFDLKSKVWQKEIDQLLTEPIHLEKRKEALHVLLELENKKGEQFINQQFFNTEKTQSEKSAEIIKLLANDKTSDGSTTTNTEERTLQDIMEIIKGEQGGNTSTKIAHEMDIIEKRLEDVRKMLNENQDDEIRDDDKIKQWIEDQEKQLDGCKFVVFLYIFVRVVKMKMKISLRETQKVAIMTLLNSENNILAQVSTGEGKSFIVAGVAIYCARKLGQKVDIITSNDMLAERDSSQLFNDGGLKDLYLLFNVNVAHNCSPHESDRIRAYNSAVVYGELSNFQRDYLLDKFYGHNIRGDRTFDRVIVDEVDCMLLDRGNNVLYLTHEIPGMEMLESLYVFIWEKIRTSIDDLESIKTAVFFDLYGEIKKDDLELVHGPLKNRPEEKEALWSHLIETDKIIDQQGRLITDDNNERTEAKINNINYSKNRLLNPNLVYFFRNVLNRKRRIRIPHHLLSFVDRHLDTFLDNAIQALMINADVHYVVDHNRSSTSLELNPQVIIIDPDTGTDQSMSQWDGGLHQFLQLKEGCRLTLQSLKSVFISNVTYIKKYKLMSGLTGTLGTQEERDYLKLTYVCDYFTVPTAFLKRFKSKRAIVVKTEHDWLDAIVEETKEILKTERSLIIFCRSIKDVKTVYHKLKVDLQDKKEAKIHRYIRNYEKIAFESKGELLGVGQVIVATNLASRGTDIKITGKLRDNGGLHICLTYLPENFRIEEQALGRAGRQGDPGSCRLVLFEPDHSTNKTEGSWPKDKIFEMKQERIRQESQRISKLLEVFEGITKQEECFGFFWELYVQHLSDDPLVKTTKSYSILDQWALWLDQVDDGRNFSSTSTRQLRDRLCNFINKLKENTNYIEWITPARSIELAIELVKRGGEQDMTTAEQLLNKLIQSNDNCLYPAAYYYRAFICIKQSVQKNLIQSVKDLIPSRGAAEDQENKKNYFIRLLRAAETIIQQHIDMHMVFSHTVDQIRTDTINRNSFYLIDAYKKQKENAIQLLWYYINSIHSLLGSRCSISDLQLAGIKDETDTTKYFNKLVLHGCILNCQVNKVETVPNRDIALKKIANDYGVETAVLNDYLKQIKTSLSEEKMEKILEKTNMFPCTRRIFWNLLIENKILTPITFDDNVELENVTSSTYVLFTPTSNIVDDLIKGKKPKDSECAILHLPTTDLDPVDVTAVFGHVISDPTQSTKIDLKTIDLAVLGQMTQKSLAVAGISEEQRPNVWKALIDQNILTIEGNLSPDYKEGITQFRYSDCPIYEYVVINLIERTFLAELVRRQWLQERDPVRRIKLITYLPLEPYQDLLWDLQSAHIISGNKVKDEYDNELENKINGITNNKNEQDRILSVLKSHQAAYASYNTLDISLEPLEQVIIQKTRDDNSDTVENLGMELCVLNLSGFSQVIKMSEDKKWWKIFKTNPTHLVSNFIAMTLGLGLFAVPVANLIGAGLLGMVASEFFKKGLKEILELTKSDMVYGKKLHWADYRHQILKKLSMFTEKWSAPDISYVHNFISKHMELKKIIPITNENVITKQMIELYTPTIGQIMAHEQQDGQINSNVRGTIEVYFENMENDLKEKIRHVFDKCLKTSEIQKTLSKLYESQGPTKVESDLRENLAKIIANWERYLEQTFSKMIESIASKLEKTRDQYLMTTEVVESQEQAVFHTADRIFNSIKEIVDEYKLVDTLSKMAIGQFQDLEKSLKTNPPVVHNKTEVENGNSKTTDFEKKMIDDVRKKIMERAENKIDSLKDRVLKKAVERTVRRRNVNRLLQLFGKERCNNWTELKKIRQFVENSKEQQSVHIQACLKLIRKTKDPSLLAALIHEGSAVDDSFCIAGMKSISLPHLEEKYGNFDIQLLLRNQEIVNLIENDATIAKAVRVGWRNYTKQKCPFDLFPVGGSGCKDLDCELRGLNDYVGYRHYVKQAFMGTRDVDSFEVLRKHFTQISDIPSENQRNNQVLIWLNIDTFMLPVIKRLGEDERKKEFAIAAEKHLKDYSRENIITEDEANQLSKYFNFLLRD